ncbi:hypothetical protein PGB90_003500 [Kerria lacca]
MDMRTIIFIPIRIYEFVLLDRQYGFRSQNDIFRFLTAFDSISVYPILHILFGIVSNLFADFGHS